MNKGNRHLLEADAERIIAMILAGEWTLSATAKRYHVANDTFYRFWLAHTTPEQRAAFLRLVVERRLKYNKKGRFKKGHRPWTKGRKGIHLSPATEFRPGTLHGAALKHLGKIGSVRIRGDKPTGPKGTRRLRRWIKVRSDGPPQYRWIPLARHLWQQAHGPIPPGAMVVYKNGHTLDDRLDNYLLVDRAGHLAVQQKLNPEMRGRCTAALKKSLAKRWAGHKPGRRTAKQVHRAIRRRGGRL